MNTADLFTKITNQLIADIEAGAPTWRMPWAKLGRDLPTSCDGRPYRGINVLWLAIVGADRGWSSNTWGTYKAWQRHDCQVRKGEKGTEVLLWRPVRKTLPDGTEEQYLVARSYAVFGAEQAEGGAELVARKRQAAPEPDTVERFDEAEAYFAAVGADVRRGGDRAYYSRATDRIVVPEPEQFWSTPHFYATLAHEHVHWTGHDSRLAREMGNRFGDDAYAAEELVAELGAAMWCGQMGVSAATREDHVGYLAGWLRVLKADPKALLTVASKAQQAVDRLNVEAGFTVAPDFVAV